MNWTGLGIAFPRTKWPEIRQRSEFIRAGLYILDGLQDDNQDERARASIPSASLPTLYIGQADGVRDRIDAHYQSKDVCDRGIVFVSNSGGLNRAHVTWLEYALLKRPTETGQCRLDNVEGASAADLVKSMRAKTGPVVSKEQVA
jgi:hypothetical protein